MTAVKPPSTLGKRGRALWRPVTAAYDLRPDELQLLAELCHVLDTIEALRAALEGEPLVVPTQRDGSKPHPALRELRSQQKMASELVARLRLADTDAAFAAATQAAGRWNSRSHRRSAG